MSAEWEPLERLAYGVIVHEEHGDILFANAPAAALAGVSRGAELVGRRIEELFEPPYLKGLRARLLAADGDLPEALQVHERLKRPDGRVVDVQVASVPFVQGARGRVQLVFHDLGPQLRAAEGARREGLAQLAGGVAHELNNVLATILAHAAVLKDALPFAVGAGAAASQVPAGADSAVATSPLLGDLDAIASASQRGGQITSRLLGYAHGGRYLARAIDVMSLMRALTARVRETRPEVAVNESFEAGPLQVVGDAAQLTSVLDALCDNALAALDGKGADVAAGARGPALTFRSERVHLSSRELAEDGVGGGAFAYMEIADTGVGMSPAVLARAFEPYYSTHGQGRGLGLAMVRGVVQHHGGIVRLESHEGVGTYARLWLPLAGAALVAPLEGLDADAFGRMVEPGLQASTTPDESVARSLVMVVDDEPLVRRATQRVLTRLGYDVVEAPDGKGALALFEASGPATLACVLLDMQMPGLRGEEVLLRLRDMRPDVPVVVLTGYQDDAIVARLLALGRVGFLTKPFGIAELGAEIKRVCRTA